MTEKPEATFLDLTPEEQKQKDAPQNIAEALVLLQENLESIDPNRSVKVKMKMGGEYAFMYATYREIREKIKTPLSNAKCSVHHYLKSDTVVTQLTHQSGEFIDCEIPIKGNLSDPQSFGSAVTYAKRYGLVLLLGLATEEDDDGNAASGNSVQSAKVKRDEDGEQLPWYNTLKKDLPIFKKRLNEGKKAIELLKKISQHFIVNNGDKALILSMTKENIDQISADLLKQEPEKPFSDNVPAQAPPTNIPSYKRTV